MQRLISLAVAGLFVALPLANARQEKVAASLPLDLVAAWKKEGAQVGWMGIGEFEALTFETRQNGKIGEVPAFKFDVWKSKVLDTLPAPDKEFGLCLGDTKVTDAGLKELSALKTLHSLDLGFTPAT